VELSDSIKDYIKRLNIIEPEDLRVREDGRRNSLEINIRGKVYRNVIPKKPFPLTNPQLVIFTQKDYPNGDICTLRDYRLLDAESKRCLEKYLSKVCFIPVIERIQSIRYKGEVYEWKVETSRGLRVFHTRGRRSIYRFEEGKVSITDTNDNIYLITDVSKLDRKSRVELEKVL